MRFHIDHIHENPTTLLRRAGYTFQYQEDGEASFIRPLAKSGYPRFHAYVKASGSSLLISFHLDHKKHTYGEETRHHGEYDESRPLHDEAERIKSVLAPAPIMDYDPI